MPILLFGGIFLLVCLLSASDTNTKKVEGPKYFIIGVQKAATTSLHELLTQHPQICANKKEPHFFDNPLLYSLGPSYYQSLFETGCTKGGYIDSTPDYVRTRDIADKIRATLLPAAIKSKRVILILRDPIKREFSAYEHMLRNCILSIKKNLRVKSKPKDGWTARELCSDPAGGLNGYCSKLDCHPLSSDSGERLQLNRSKGLGNINLAIGVANFSAYVRTAAELTDSVYADQLLELLKIFRRNQIFVINFDQLVSKTAMVMNALERFMRIKPFFGSTVTLPQANEAKVSPIFDCESRDRLSAFFEPHNQRLYRLLQDRNISRTIYLLDDSRQLAASGGGNLRSGGGGSANGKNSSNNVMISTRNNSLNRNRDAQIPPHVEPSFQKFPKKETYKCDRKII